MRKRVAGEVGRSLALAAALAALLPLGCGEGGNGQDGGDGPDRASSEDTRPRSPFNLLGTRVDVQVSRVNVGESIQVAFEVQNDGQRDVADFQVQLALAKMKDGSGEIIRLGLPVDVKGLQAGKRYSSEPLSAQIPLDVRSGSFYVVAIVDPENLVDENDETDNVGSTLLPIQVVNPLIPNLIVVTPEKGQPAVALSQSSVIPGSPLTAQFTVKNVGMMPVLAFQVGIYLSKDNRVSDDDIAFDKLPVSALVGDEEKALSATFTLPRDLAFGNYYVLAQADDANAIDEGDETDNTGASAILVVRMPPEHFTDLIATDVTVRNGNPERGNQTTFFYGDPLDVTATFHNLGDIAAGFFATRVFLSEDQTFDPPRDPAAPMDGGTPAGSEDLLISTFNTDGLAGEMSVTQTKSRDVSSTIPKGTYYVILQVDSENTVDESDFEGNNIVVVNEPITISGDPPPPSNDTCSAPLELQFDAGGVATVQQSTQFALGDYAGSCGGGSGRDLVYTFTTSIPRSLRVNVAGIDAAVYLRQGSCEDAMDGGTCASGRDLFIKNLAAGTYYLVVDGAGEDDAGAFTLTATLAEPVPPAYTISTVAAAYSDISSTGTEITPFTNSTDGGCSEQQIGFSFPFFDQTYTTLRISGDGYLQLGATGSCSSVFTNQNLPSSTGPNNIIAVFWDDLGWSSFSEEDDPLIAQRKVFVLRQANRMVVQWHRWRFYGSEASDLNFQVILHSNGNIEMQYGTMSDTDMMRARGDDATIGVENADATDAYQFSYNSASLMPPTGLLFTKAQ